MPAKIKKTKKTATKTVKKVKAKKTTVVKKPRKAKKDPTPGIIFDSTVGKTDALFVAKEESDVKAVFTSFDGSNGFTGSQGDEPQKEITNNNFKEKIIGFFKKIFRK